MRYVEGGFGCCGCGVPNPVRHRGYYSPPPGYGCNGYGYGNPPAIVDRPVCVVDTVSEDDYEEYDDYF